MTPLIKPDWFTADHHLGHENILKFEPEQRGHYNSIRHMNADIVARHNALVSPDETVLFLGDLAMGRPFEETLEWVAKMNGKKYFVPGNHDRPHPIMTKNPDRRAEFQKEYEAVGLIILPLELDVLVGDTPVKVSHYPYKGVVDGGIVESDKHDKWRPEPSAQPLVHGHIHLHRVVRDNMFNVGIGVHNLEPVPASAVADWLETL